MENKKKIMFIVASLFIVMTSSIFYIISKKSEKDILKLYDTKTKITTLYNYIINKDGDTILNGNFFQYNNKGTKIASGHGVNGHLKGEFTTYYDNGNLKFKRYILDKKRDAENTEYYLNGKVSRYIMFDDFGSTAFIARYDTNGNIKSYEGYPIMEIYQYKLARKKQFKINKTQYLKIGDFLEHKYLIANIPYAKRSFTLELVGSDKLKSVRIVDSISIVQTNYSERLTQKGINKMRAIVKYEFNDKSRTTINDTISFEVEVH